MNQNKQLGYQGELMAEMYLVKLGYKIIAKNYRIGKLELDIITSYRQKLIFIEVKTRKKTTESANDTHINSRQITNLKQAINTFCVSKKYNLESTQLDLILIMFDKKTNKSSLTHYHDIF